MAGPEEMPDVKPNGIKRASPDVDLPLPRKKFKTEELPLSAAQHTAIEELLHSFKKKGSFDHVRKKIWADFDEGVCYIYMFFHLKRNERIAHCALFCRNIRQSLQGY